MNKILLIDDSNLSRKILKRALEDSFIILEATSGMDGLERYFLERPDLVILDLTMGDMNGMDVLARIRELDPSARVIIGTADVQDYSRHQAEALGAEAFLTKPFQADRVQALVQQVLARAGG